MKRHRDILALVNALHDGDTSPDRQEDRNIHPDSLYPLDRTHVSFNG